MIPAGFDYAAPTSIDEALTLLTEGGDDAKLLAGGHSLLPLMKLRFAAPSLLIDLKNVPGLFGIEHGNGDGVRIGALTTHATVQADQSLGLPAEAARQIADQQVRNRGTIGGSLAHGDPASDLPTVLLTMDGSVTARGPGGERTIAAADLFQDYLTTAIADDEVITDVRLPATEGYGHAYLKFARRAEDWAMVGVAALVRGTGTFEDVRIGLTHMGSTPLRATQVEQALIGQPIEPGRIRAAAEAAGEGTDPPGDLNATPDYKRHLARVLVRRAIEQAAGLH
jgi:carbon-monoxide dehydrogenase medium subunit